MGMPIERRQVESVSIPVLSPGTEDHVQNAVALQVQLVRPFVKRNENHARKRSGLDHLARGRLRLGRRRLKNSRDADSQEEHDRQRNENPLKHAEGAYTSPSSTLVILFACAV